MGKFLLKLHQPHKWKKHSYVTDDDYAEIERLIYNNLDVEPYLKKINPELNTDWLNEIMKEDETYDFLSGDLNGYAITTFGRVINLKRKKSITPTSTGNKLYVYLKRQSVELSKEFLELGWIYSHSFIVSKYQQYNWNLYITYVIKNQENE